MIEKPENAPEGATHYKPRGLTFFREVSDQSGRHWEVWHKGDWLIVTGRAAGDVYGLIPLAGQAGQDHRHAQPAAAERTGLPVGSKRVLESPMSNEELRQAIEGTFAALRDLKGLPMDNDLDEMLREHLRHLLEVEAARAASMLVEVSKEAAQ